MTHHSKLEPQPVLSGDGDLSNTATSGVNLTHHLVQSKLERVSRRRMQHMCVVHRMQLVSVWLRQPGVDFLVCNLPRQI